MQIDYIKVPISKEIDERGGASIRLVNLLTVALGDSIKEAVQGGYVIGDAVLVTKQFQGLLKSMVEGLERDGMARQIGDYITIYPKFTGPIDLDKGYDPEANPIKLGIRILGSEYEIDTKNLTFHDVTPGKLSFSIDEVSSGEETKLVDLSKEIKITGRDFPKKDDLRVRVEVPELGVKGYVDTEKFTRSATVITIAAGALKDFLEPKEIAGKKATFTVLGGFNNASCSVPASVTIEPKILSILSEGTGLDSDLTTLKDKVTVSVEGCSLRNAKAQFILRDHDGRYMASTDFDDRYHYADFEILSNTEATYHCRENGSEEPDGSWAAYDAALQIKLEDGTILEKPVNIRS